MRNAQIRQESAFYFFEGAVCQTPESAVTTLVTYHKRKRLVPLFVGKRTPYVRSLQKMYASIIKRGTLTLHGVIEP